MRGAVGIVLASVAAAGGFAVSGRPSSLPPEGFRVHYARDGKIRYEVKASAAAPNDYFALSFPESAFNDRNRYGALPDGSYGWRAPAPARVIFMGQINVMGGVAPVGNFVAKVMKNAPIDAAGYVCADGTTGVGACSRGRYEDVCTGIGDHPGGFTTLARISFACEEAAAAGDTYRLALWVDSSGGHDCGEACMVTIDPNPAHTFFSAHVEYR